VFYVFYSFFQLFYVSIVFVCVFMGPGCLK